MEMLKKNHKNVKQELTKESAETKTEMDDK